MPLTVLCAALAAGSPIPPVYTGAGQDRSPPLQWSGSPEGTASFAVICHDPDAPGVDWSHWVLFNLPADARSLPEGVPPGPAGPAGSVQGINDFGRPGYGGPLPPPGRPHRYFFRVYALDRVLDLGPQARQRDVERAMKGHVLAEGHWMGTFER